MSHDSQVPDTDGSPRICRLSWPPESTTIKERTKGKCDPRIEIHEKGGSLGLLLPVIILGFLLSFGLSPTAVTEFREKRRVEIRLATGLILILLALLLQLGLI